MEIKKDYDVYGLMCACWGGAEDTLRIIIRHDLEDEFMDLFDEVWYDQVPDLTQVNDWLRFEWEDIFEYLEIEDEEEDG